MRILDFSDSFESSVEPTTDTLPASMVEVTPTGNLAADDAQEAFEELQTDIDTRVPRITSTDEAIARYDGTTGAVQNSGVTIDDSNNIIVPGNLRSDGTTVDLADATTADIATSGTASTVNIGTGSGANVVNIGGANTTVNITGSVNNENVTNLNVTDKLITINDGGAAASGGGSGIEIEENGSATGYVKVSTDRNSFSIKAPNTNGVATLTPGASADDVVLAAASQTLTNKTLTSPSISTPTGITKSDVGLGNVDNTSDSTKNSASVTLINKTIDGASNTITNVSLTSGVTGTLPIGNGGSGQTSANAALNAFLPSQTGNSGKFLKTNATDSAWSSVSASDVGLGNVDNTSDATKNAASVTLTNKTINGSSNTITNVSLTAGVTGTLPITNGGTGQTSPTAAFDALAPTQTSNSGKFLTTNGSTASWSNPTISLTDPLVTTYTTGASSGTHTMTGSPLYVRVRMVGGGGGGSGSGTASMGNGGNGSASTFGSHSAGGGSGATGATAGGGAGGTASIAGGGIGIGINGASGSGGCGNTLSFTPSSGAGGNSALGGSGGGMIGSSTGNSAATNSGSGGGGGGAGQAVNAGGGGGAGAFIDIIIASPSGSYSYAVGDKGAGGSAGTSGNAGGAGGVGFIEITEYYQ